LNIIYDPIYTRINCTQSSYIVVAAPQFEYPTNTFFETFDDSPILFSTTFGDKISTTTFTINVPNTVYSSDLLATVNQIAFTGAKFTINQFEPDLTTESLSPLITEDGLNIII
jgi:hypothetical protein